MPKFQIFFSLLEDVDGFDLYWACGIEGDANERKQKGRSGQMSGEGTTENYIGFGCESALWRKEKATLGLPRKALLKGKVLRFLFFWFKLCFCETNVRMS